LLARTMDMRPQEHRLANKLAPTEVCSYFRDIAFSVGAHEHREAAIAFCLIHRHRGLAVLVLSYRACVHRGLSPKPWERIHS